MPLDDYGAGDDDDEKKELANQGQARRFKDFDCPDCNANNPTDGFGDGDEMRCNYCGIEWRAIVSEEGRLKFKEI